MTARHDEAWYQRRDAQAREWLALADKRHTPEELAAARAALNRSQIEPQQPLFNAPPHAGVATDGQPEPCGLADAPNQGARRSHANF